MKPGSEAIARFEARPTPVSSMPPHQTGTFDHTIRIVGTVTQAVGRMQAGVVLDGRRDDVVAGAGPPQCVRDAEQGGAGPERGGGEADAAGEHDDDEDADQAPTAHHCAAPLRSTVFTRHPYRAATASTICRVLP